jgi:hypothetical protein
MRTATAAVLLLLGLASVAGGVAMRPRAEATPAGSGQPVFPGIATALDTASTVSIASAGKASTLVRRDGKWTLAERGNYPVQPQKMRSLFAGLVELRLLEPRTADPASFARLGVDDPTTKSSTAVSLKVAADGGAVLADILLGHRSQRSQGGLPEAVYIRRPTETRAWLAEGGIPADADPQSWLIREILDIPAERIAHVTVSHDDEKLEFARAGEGMTLSNPPEGKLDEYRVTEVGKALENLTLADVRQGSLPGTPVGKAIFTTTDGLSIEINVSRDEKLVWANFAATGNGAQSLSNLSGWAYQLPEWRQTSLVPTAKDLIATESTK